MVKGHLCEAHTELLGGGLSLLERRPYLAGFLFGMMIYKPQLALLLPVALLGGRQWRAFAAASVTAGVLLAASALWFGTDVWAEYLRNVNVLRQAIRIQLAVDSLLFGG